MRLAGFIPVVLCTAALVMSFLCLFAGSSKGFMEDYAIVTLNTSRLGENLLNASRHSSNPFVSILDNITNSIENELNGDINDLAHDLGLHDWYSAHVLDFCEGYYVPGPVPNATLSKSSIYKNVTSCSNSTAMYRFDPHRTLQQELDKSGHSDIDLSDLDWPEEINKGLHALWLAQAAVFVLYCIAIGLIFVALILSIVSVFFDGRLSAFVNVVVDWLAFLAICIASAIVTVIADKAAHLINKYGNDIGVSAQRGTKFITLTWVSTAIVFVAGIVWCFECIMGRKRGKAYTYPPKYA